MADAPETTQKASKILVVEDSPTQIEKLRFLLEESGFSVVAATNGKEALAAARANPIDLVISDIVMPEMDGYALCRALRVDRTLRDLPVILLTSLADTRDVIRGLEAGANNFICKPYDDRALLARVQNVIANQAIRKATSSEMGISIFFAGQRFFITADRLQILDLLLSTYENAVNHNNELMRTRDELRALNEQLEARVATRTAALRESETRLASIVDSALDGIITIDDQERILVFNAAAEEMFGCPAAEAIGQPVERFIPERFQQVQRLGQMSKTHRVVGQPTSSCGRRASGGEFPIEASISRTEVHGHLLFTIILRDITERVRNEEARAQLEAQIRLTQKLEALGTLAAGITHDFNNILGAIIGNTELARQDVGANHPAMKSLDEIRKASDRAQGLVHRILTFTSHRQEPQSVIPLRPVVEEAFSLLRATLPTGVEIAVTCDADAPMVLADSTQIHQVLINLCTNAWHAMEAPTGRIDIGLDGITLDAEAARADASLRPGHFARLCVTDTGTGMDAATLERIFEPFFTTKPVGQGTGLGLSVVHGIVKAHGGAITVTSQPGEGTTFTLYFPAVQAPKPSAAPDDAPKPLPAAGGQHVLYLDDEEALVFLVTRMLERLGYRVSGYTRAEEALAAVRADPGQFDLVVTDLNMPGMSGLDVARALARLRPDLPVVLASGYITEELRAQAPQAGVRQLIYKPNTVDELCAVVQRLADAPKQP